MNSEPSTIISYEVSSNDGNIGLYRGGVILFRKLPQDGRCPAVDNVPMIPLEGNMNLSCIYRDGRQSGEICVGTKDGREVTILTDRRHSCEGFNYVGLIDGGPHSNGDEVVECWNKDGKPQYDSENQLYLFPQEMRGFIGIWHCKTTPVVESPSQALNNLKASYGSDIELKDVFIVPVYWYADPDQENVPL